MPMTRAEFADFWFPKMAEQSARIGEPFTPEWDEQMDCMWLNYILGLDGGLTERAMAVAGRR